MFGCMVGTERFWYLVPAQSAPSGCLARISRLLTVVELFLSVGISDCACFFILLFVYKFLRSEGFYVHCLPRPQPSFPSFKTGRPRRFLPFPVKCHAQYFFIPRIPITPHFAVLNPFPARTLCTGVSRIPRNLHPKGYFSL